MAKYSNTVEYNIRTTIDTTGMAKLQAQLTQLQNHVTQMGAKELMPAYQVNDTLNKIKKIQSALTQAFNPKLGMLNTSSFMKNVGMSMNDMYKTFSNIGPVGERAFTSMYGQISKIDTGLKSVSKTTDKIMNTLGNTVRWGLIASAFASVMRAVHGAAQYVTDLDKSLTNIQMVTAASRDTMNDFAVQANKVAQELGGTTVQMTNATEVFIRQGYDLATSTQLGEYAVHLANVSGQDSAMASDEITAYMNAFKIPLDDLGNAVSKWAAVANNAAVSVEELSVASQKAAAVATTVGVDMDQFAAHIAAIEATTREAPENIGNGLKTIYSRIADVKLGETLEDGVDLGSFAKAIEKVGVDVLDATGNLRNAGDILEDLMVVWKDLDQTQRAAVAKTVAGRFQLARFEALMNSADIYEKSLKTSQAEVGTTTYDRMQETYRNSLEGRTHALQASVEEIFLNIFTTDSFYGFVDAAQLMIDTINKLVKATGGGEAALTALLVIMSKLASNSIARGVGNFVTNRQMSAQAQENIQAQQMLAIQQLQGKGLHTDNVRMNAFANDTARLNQFAGQMNAEQIRQVNELIDQRVIIENNLSTAIEKRSSAEQTLRVALQEMGATGKMTTAELEALVIQFRGMSEEELLASEGFKELSGQIRFGAQQFTNFKESLMAFESGSKSFIAVQTEAQNLSKTLQGLADTEVLTNEQMQKLEATMRMLQQISNGDAAAIKQMITADKQFYNSLIQMAAGLELSEDQLQKVAIALSRATAEMGVAQAEAKRTAGQFEMMGHGLQIQNLTNNIIGLSSSLMTGFFALQSFTGLIKTINNEDLTFAEKWEQGMLNLIMLIAMGIPAITSFKSSIQAVSTALKEWEAVNISMAAAESALQASSGAAIEAKIMSIYNELAAKKALNKETFTAMMLEAGYKEEKIEQIAITLGLVSAEEAQAAAGAKGLAVKMLQAPITKILTAITTKWAGATWAQTAAQWAQNASLGALLGIYGAVALAITGIILLIKAYSDAEEARKQALQANIDASNEAVAAIKENKTHLDSLYSQWVSTTKASDEFKNALLEQAEALGIVNAEQMIALGKYKELKQEIDEATASQLAYNSALLREQNKTLHGTDVSTDLKHKAGVSTHTETETYEDVSIDYEVSDISKYQELLRYKERVTELSKDLTDLSKEEARINHDNTLSEEDRVKQLEKNKKKQAEINKEISEYTKVLQNENNQQLLANGNQIAENQRMAALYDSGSVLHSSSDLEAYLGEGNTKLTSLDDLESLITQGAFGEELKDYYEALGPEAARAFLLSFGQEINKANLGLDADNLKLQSAMNVAGATYGKAAVARGSFENQEDAQAHFEDIINGNTDLGISEDFYNLSDRERATIVLGIDSSKTQEEITEEINDVIDRLNNGETLKDIYPNVEVEDDDDILSRMENGRGDKDWDRDAEAVKRYADELQDLAEESDQIADSLKNNREAAVRVADANARMNKGIETLASNWDKWGDVLADTAEEGTPEYIEALDGAKQALEDVLDVDMSDFANGTEFVKDHLDDIALAADGDVEAIERLREAAAEQILIDAGFDLDNLDADAQAVSDFINNYPFEDLEIGATLDDTGYTDVLQAMLDNGSLTVDQLNAILNSLGFEPDISWEPVDMDSLSSMSSDSVIHYEDSEGQMHEATLSAYLEQGESGQVYVPVINGSKTSYQGAPAATVNPSSHKGGKGGGGGGGGGSKGKKIEKAEAKTAEIDPYQKVNAELEKLGDNYTEVDKAKERMYGDRYRRAAEAEIKNLQAQNDKLEERIEISKKLIEAYQTGKDNPEYGIYLNGESLAKYGLTDNNFDGIIDNRWERIEQLALDYQTKLDAANALAGEDRSEAEQEEFQRLSDIAEEAYDLWSGAQGFIDEYEGTWDKIRDDTEQIKENTYQIEDAVIDIWNYAKDAAKELGDFRNDQIDLAETLATLWGNDAVKSLGFAFDRFTNMFEANEKALSDTIIDYRNRLNKATDEDMKKWYQDQIDLAQQAIANGTSVLDLNMQRARDIFKALDEWKATGKSSLFGSNEKAMWEAFDEAWKDAVDYASDLKGYIEDIHDNMQDVMDDMYDVMDERDKMFDQAKDQYEYLKDMTELVYGEKAYGTLETITRKQAQADEEHLKTLEQERQINHEMLESLEEGSEEYKDALEKERDLDSAILDIRKDIADTYREAKELANDLAIQNWLDNFTADVNGVQVPLEYAADAWERIKENADNYLDDLNRAWELEKLENEYLKLIDEAVDPNLQRQITEQMEQQLEYLREKDKLSQYDVNYANAQLEILQKTIALEDARANKNQMKLRRDSQGNYSYVYAADRNDVRDKENDLLDARMNGYNMSVEASTDATDRYLQKVQSMADALRDVANDQSLSQEQIEAITQSIIEDGYQFLDAMGEQLTTAQRNGIESYIQAAQELSELNAGNVLDISQQLEQGLIDDLGMVTDVFNAAVLEWVDGETGLSYFRDSANQAGEDIVRNVGDFVAAVGAANANIQTPLNDIQGGLTKTNQAMSDLTSSAKEFYNFLEDKSGVVQRAAQDLAYYQDKLTDMGDEMNAYYTEWNKRGKELESEKAINSQLNIDIDSLKKEKEQLEKQLEEAVKGSNKGGSGGSGNKGNYSDSDIAWGIAQNIWTYGSWGNDPYRHSRITERYGEAIADLTQRYINDYWATGQLVNWDSDVWGYATGGYTGSWTDNENGRIALLHQKELVLNEEDTENMLAAISIVRDLVDKIKGSSFKDTMNSFTNNSGDFVGNNIEQRVEIKAEFPGVRSAADIENALINLSNKAYQYAYNQNEKFI